MNKTVLDTIRQIRGGRAFHMSGKNQNIYRVLIQEADSQTAYYFNTPVYRRSSGRLVDLNFLETGGVRMFEGANSMITSSGRKMKLSDSFGDLLIDLDGMEGAECVGGVLYGRSIRVEPTLNGIAVEASMQGGEPFTFEMRTTEAFERIKSNSKYIAFMREQFAPFFVISTLYARENGSGKVFPATVTLERVSDRTYLVHVEASTRKAHTLLFEINLYEGKFFQDTTVESRSPSRNNCYGSVAFLGQTLMLGEQWLYTKTSRKKVFDIERMPIRYVRMYIPIFEKGKNPLTAFLPRARFCSFGSNWKNKIACGDQLTVSESIDGYYRLDLTALLTDPKTHCLRRSEGVVLRNMPGHEDCSVIATGDCCYAPQILEVGIEQSKSDPM